MCLRVICSVLVAVTLSLVSPMTAYDSARAAPLHRTMQMVDTGHCDSMPSDGKHHKAPVKRCCASICMAVAVTGAEPSGEFVDHPVPVQFVVRSIDLAYVSEITTPPPRRT
jgi:PIN domain nuclease of toxin-antitoxin system